MSNYLSLIVQRSQLKRLTLWHWRRATGLAAVSLFHPRPVSHSIKDNNTHTCQWTVSETAYWPPLFLFFLSFSLILGEARVAHVGVPLLFWPVNTAGGPETDSVWQPLADVMSSALPFTAISPALFHLSKHFNDICSQAFSSRSHTSGACLPLSEGCLQRKAGMSYVDWFLLHFHYKQCWERKCIFLAQSV